jgi:hypothetical protein
MFVEVERQLSGLDLQGIALMLTLHRAFLLDHPTAKPSQRADGNKDRHGQK